MDSLRLTDMGFTTELNCLYKDEQYSARDTGEVLRHPRSSRIRPSDNKWTFGKPNKKTGYMEVASVRVHRIIATAFHGPAPTDEHVVDHIDTNKHNNRPENLWWVTRLENILLNPITSRRIELICGSVEAFLADPSAFRDKFPDPNYQWMCQVDKEEAARSLERMLAWAKSGTLPSGGTLGTWIFNRSYYQAPVPEAILVNPITQSKSQIAVQRNWKTPCEFVHCPRQSFEEPIRGYAEQLKQGSLFYNNEYGSGVVIQVKVSEDFQSMYVISESESPKPLALAKITFEDGLYVHEGFGTFFTLPGAEKRICEELGIEWTGEETIDDYC